MKPTSLQTLGLLAALSLAFLTPFASAQSRQIRVSDAGQLYRAVNNSANAGAVVQLEPGIYMLDPSQPNAGRLELQKNMALRGSTDDPEKSVIDASGLPASSYSIPPLMTGAVRIGKGRNSLEWLTVQGARNGASAITTDLVLGSAAQVRIAHVIARGNVRGLDVRNVGASSAGRVLEIEIADNLFVDNFVGAGQGLRLINSDASGARILATLRGNQSARNIAGCIAANINTRGASITIDSFADRFEENGNGCVFIAGLSQATATTLSEDNLLVVQAHASSFQHNRGTLPVAFPVPGGIIAVGGQSLGAADRASGNMLHIELWGAKFGDNGTQDIAAYGAFTSASQSAGSYNEVLIELRGVAKRAEVITTSGVPEAPKANFVNVIR